MSMTKALIFNNLIDTRTKQFVVIELPEDYVMERLEEVSRVASESGKRFRKAFGKGKTITNGEKQL